MISNKMSGLLRVVCDFVWETRTLAQMCALVDCYCIFNFYKHDSESS